MPCIIGHARTAFGPGYRYMTEAGSDRLIVREYRETDLEAVVALWQECGLVVPQNNPRRDIERKLRVDSDLFLVGLVSNRLAATVMGGYEGHRGWINYLAVSPAYQRRGYGQQIMAAVESRIRQKGCPKINLQVRAGNAAVIDFYRAIGYQDDRVIGLGKRLAFDQ
jgi:ribosomal protein S18 acetylase RimI-like enzyme